jgi:hypothetical protein
MESTPSQGHGGEGVRVVDCVQRSPEWHQARLGRLCGSKAGAMMAAGKGVSRQNLLVQLVLERVNGRSSERDYQSAAMLQGIEREADALMHYEVISGRLVRPVGYVQHDDLMAGFSPDGILGDFEGFVEAKSPEGPAHYEYLTKGRIPKVYLEQIRHAFFCVPSLQYCDWFSYNPDFGERLQMKLVRVFRKDLNIGEYDEAARWFLGDVDLAFDALRTMADPIAVLREGAVA